MEYEFIDYLLKCVSYSYQFYNKGWMLYSLLSTNNDCLFNIRSRFINTVSSDILHLSSYLGNVANSYCNWTDNTVAVISNVATVNAYQYLWGREGRNVYINLDDGYNAGTPDITTFEYKVQKAISADKKLNRAIKKALKDGIDYGVGYLVDIDGKYFSPHPLRVFKHDGDHDDLFVLERWSDEKQKYILHIIGSGDKYKKKLGINSSKKYFMVSLQEGKNGKRYEIGKDFFASQPLIHEFKPMSFETEDGIATGSGIVAVNAAINLQKMSFSAVYAQEEELRPAMLVRQDLLRKRKLSIAPGSIHTFNQYNTNSGEPIRSMIPARGGSAASFVEYWVGRVRQAYFPENASFTGVGQTTAAEANQIATTSTNSLANLKTSFHDWFLTPILETFIDRMPKDSVEKDIIKNSTIRYIGQHTADLLNADIQNLRVLAEAYAVLKPDNPTIGLMSNGVGIMQRIARDVLPNGTVLTNQEYAEAMNILLQQQQALGEPAAEEAAVQEQQ